jgi:CheY-like chemotaxis protein
MPPEVLEKAVDPFFTTKAAGEGTGLGLSVIYGFIKQSRGHLRIYSEVGRGTSVKLYLPRALQEAVDIKPVAVETPRGHGETILVVEDDATVRSIISDALQDLGYSVLTAADARLAIPLLQSKGAIDLLISDVILPHVNGRKLAEIARTTRPALKVLFVSGYSENAIIRGDLTEAGMDMLTKPFALDTLGAKVHAMIKGPPPQSWADHTGSSHFLRASRNAARADPPPRHSSPCAQPRQANRRMLLRGRHR